MLPFFLQIGNALETCTQLIKLVLVSSNHAGSGRLVVVLIKKKNIAKPKSVSKKIQEFCDFSFDRKIQRKCSYSSVSFITFAESKVVSGNWVFVLLEN